MKGKEEIIGGKCGFIHLCFIAGNEGSILSKFGKQSNTDVDVLFKAINIRRIIKSNNLIKVQS